MIIVAGYVHTDPDDRDRYVDGFVDLVTRARNSTGCLDMSFASDSVDPSRINVYERWDSQENLDHFRANANAPELGVEIRDGSMKEYLVESSREPFSTE